MCSAYPLLRRGCMAVLAALLLAGCQVFAAPLTPTPGFKVTLPSLAAPTPTPTKVAAQQVVNVYVWQKDGLIQTQPLFTGETVALEIHLRPEIVSRTSDGITHVPWEDAPAMEMQWCVAFDAPCQPDTTWQPLAEVSEVPLSADWLGERVVWVGVRVRQQGGPAVLLYTPGDEALPLAQLRLNLVTAVNTATPLAAQPPVVQTALVGTLQAYPVQGSLELAGGSCCAGATAGSTVQIAAAFQASSAYGRVTEMRIARGCPKPEGMNDAPWEPFAPQRAYAATVPLNWSSFAIAVQYRDEQGNLSPVYCDDVSLEGSPVMPTP